METTTTTDASKESGGESAVAVQDGEAGGESAVAVQDGEAGVSKSSAGGRKGSQSKNVSFVDLGIPEVEKIFAAQKFGILHTDSYSGITMLPEGNNESNEDLISQLPNHILEFIICLLPMNQGATTSILSQRWRYLWRTSASCLEFRASTIFGYQYPRDMFKNKSTNILYKEGRAFTRRVNKLWNSRSALRLDALWVSFPLGNESASHVDRWLEFAVSQRITELNLNFDFANFGLIFDHDKAYKFPTHIFTENHGSLKYLTLKFCVFEFPPNFNGFNSLVSLTIEYMGLTNSDVRNILSNCSSLESLSLLTHTDDHKLKFSSPSSPVLKHISCQSSNASKVEIRDINIMSFEVTFQQAHSILSIKNAPSLTRLHLSGATPIEVIWDIPPSLEMLLFSFWCWKNDWFKSFKHNMLKRLVIDATLFHSKINLPDVIHALEASLLLQKLELNMGTSIETSESLEKMKIRPRYHHHNLKEVDIFGFEGCATIIEFAKYLLKNVVVLEKMKISTKQKGYYSNGLCSHHERRRYGETMVGEGMSIVEVHQLLQKEVRSPTKLIVCSHE